jgi:hypothetical protein
MMIPLLAQAAEQDFQVSGKWIIALLVAVIPLIGAVWIKAKAAGRGETKISEPVPEIPTKRVYSPPTFSQHQDLVRRVGMLENETKEHREYVEAQLRDIRREQNEQFVKLMNAGETRKDAIMESMNDMVRNFHSRVDQLIDGHRPHTLKK